MAEANGTTVMVQGRIVWTSGKDVFTGEPKVDQFTKQPRLGKDNVQQVEYGFGLAVSKQSIQPGGPNEALWNGIHTETFTQFPSRQVPPAYAWKYKDGDGVDHKGVPYSQRQGHAGHLIFACTTTIPIKFFRYENGQNIMVNEGIKCGDYVQVQLNIKTHPAIGQGKPGLYLNPNAVLFLGYGEAIVNTPSGDQIFGTTAPPLPPGASATPMAPSNNMLVPTGAPPAFVGQGWQNAQPVPFGGAQPVPFGGAQPGGQPAFAPSMGQPSVAAPGVQPNYGVLPAAHQPQMQPPQVQQFAPPPQPQYQQPVQQMAPPQQFAPQGAAPAMPSGMPPVPGFPQR